MSSLTIDWCKKEMNFYDYFINLLTWNYFTNDLGPFSYSNYFLIIRQFIFCKVYSVEADDLRDSWKSEKKLHKTID